MYKKCSSCKKTKRLAKFLPENGDVADLSGKCWKCRLKSGYTPNPDGIRSIYRVGENGRPEKRCFKCERWLPFPEKFQHRTGTLNKRCLDCNREGARNNSRVRSERAHEKAVEEWKKAKHFCGRDDCNGTPGQHKQSACPFRPLGDG